MKYVNTTDYTTASSFDEKYNYLAVNGKYNESVLEFFSYWCSNSSLADNIITILGNIREANTHLSKYGSAAFNYLEVEDTKIVLYLQIDNEEYVVGGEMNLTIVILSNNPLGKVPADIFGFENRYGGYYLKNKHINYTGIIEFNVMDKVFAESFKTDVPACSACTGWILA